MKLDEWQQQVLETKGNICLRAGRQVGKSTIISIKAAEYAANNPKKTILIIASVERQALLLFEKTLAHLFDNYKQLIKKGRDKPTKHKINLTNGSTIYSLPTGLAGLGIRGYTVDLLIADEAAFIPEDVWTAVTPMLAITGGDIILLSTPFGREGYFARCFTDDNYTKFHISSEECPRRNEEFLKREKERMTKLQYAQEYQGEFIDELRQFFPDDLIKSCLTLQQGFASNKGGGFSSLSYLPPSPTGEYYLGVDVARMGDDETVMLTLKKEGEAMEQEDMRITEKTRLTDTIMSIKALDKRFNYRRIGIDTGGMGVGVFDQLLLDEQTRRKVVSIDNATRSLQYDSTRTKRLLKEDLYNNLLVMMQQGRIKLFDSPEVRLSLKSIQAEYDNGRLHIFGDYSHIAEALIRAAWCAKEKGLNIWIA